MSTKQFIILIAGVIALLILILNPPIAPYNIILEQPKINFPKFIGIGTVIVLATGITTFYFKDKK